jgi:AraC family transcriptional regulator of adaptative response / DNA-3-methyladenine glycosylase II
MSREDSYYQAMLARDPRFDGKFFVGVKTTGVYCRPICPARPLRKNVEFFPTQVAAEKAGFRPCLRCRPEGAPSSPAWIGTSAVVQRALRVLAQENGLDKEEEKFAERFGLTARHLRRLFVEETGKSPKQISDAIRLNLARKLITETELPLGQVGLAAGFKSVRRFNDSFRDRFKRSPGEIRRKPLGKEEGITVSLSYRPPFDFGGLLKFYGPHRIGNLERVTESSYERIIREEKTVGRILVEDDPGNYQVLLTLDFPKPVAAGPIIAKVRALFDLDCDPILVANALEQDAAMKKLVKKHPGLRLPTGWDAFELGVATILGQFVSVEMARMLVSDLIENLGDDANYRWPDGQGVKLFPQPSTVAKSDLSFLRTTGARKRTVRNFAEAVANGSLSLDAAQNVDEFIAKLLALPGIGPWTASYMAMKLLRDPDSFPATDLILARALKIHAPELIEKMRPWRAYAAALLWSEYAQTLKKKKAK